MLPQLHSVTKLHSSGCYTDRNRNLGKSIARCSGLKAYDCSNGCVLSFQRDDIPEVLNLTQLTELGTSFRWRFFPELCCLTLLEHLHLEVELTDDSNLDEALCCMPHLQTVHIAFEDGVWGEVGKTLAGRLRLSGAAFSETPQLRSLLLDCVDIGLSFFQTLASKTGLTQLEFTSSEHRSYSRDFVSEVNLLRKLEVLTLHLQDEYSIGGLLSPESLPRLRRLNIGGTEDEIVALRKKFDQSLHPVLVNRKEFAWRSRSLLL